MLRFCDELIARVTRADATGSKLLRADSERWTELLGLPGGLVRAARSVRRRLLAADHARRPLEASAARQLAVADGLHRSARPHPRASHRRPTHLVSRRFRSRDAAAAASIEHYRRQWPPPPRAPAPGSRLGRVEAPLGVACCVVFGASSKYQRPAP
jgi:hypothetical protein